MTHSFPTRRSSDLQRGDEAAAHEQGLGIGDSGFGKAKAFPESRIPNSKSRIHMGIKCGIVGLPNVGKSTLFNALTKAGIAAANFPFCTLEPNVGVVPVPDPRLHALPEIVTPLGRACRRDRVCPAR